MQSQPPYEYEFEKYVCSKETLEHTINTYGVAIIPGVLDEIECDTMVNGMWDFLEHITTLWDTPIKRDDQTTWREFYKLFPLHSMLLQHHSVGHAQVSWDLRQNPKIIEIFAYFWKCSPEELLVSFDGLSFNLPPEITNKGWFRGNLWYHTDQSFLVPDFKCVQSWVTGLDVNEHDATLTFMEGSHKYHREFKETFNVQDKSNWFKISKEQEAFYTQRGCAYKAMKCPKGSMVFWDSRTIHCGVEASALRERPTIRSVIYLCYMPRRLCDNKNLKKKQKAFQELRTCNHYPCEIKMFAKAPRTYGGTLQELNRISPPVLNELGMKLAGF